MRLLRSAFLILVAAHPMFAGTSYHFQSNSEGLMQTTIAGTAEVDGGKMRMQMAQGDGLMFKSNSIVLSSDGGKTLTVLDPSTRTYFDMSIDNLASTMGAL